MTEIPRVTFKASPIEEVMKEIENGIQELQGKPCNLKTLLEIKSLKNYAESYKLQYPILDSLLYEVEMNIKYKR